MSNTEQWAGSFRVSGEGIVVAKEFVADEFPVPTVRIRVGNERDAAARVRVVEDVPEGFSRDDVGFYPDADAEKWSYHGDHVAFERAIPPGDPVETKYAIRVEDTERARAFVTEPTIADVSPAGAGDGDDEEPSGPSLDLDVDEVAVEAPDEGDAGDAADGDGRGATGGDGGRESVGDGGEPDPDAVSLSLDELPRVDPASPPTAWAGPEEGSVVERLLEELRRNDLDDEDRELLRERLDLGVPTETTARIDRLQSQVETVAAYADAIEEFLDEEGDARRLLAEYEDQVRALREDVATIRQFAGSNASDVESLAADLAEIAGNVEDVERRVEALTDDVEAVEGSVRETDQRVDAVEDSVRKNRGRVDEVAATAESNAADVDRIESEITDLEAYVERVESDLDSELSATAADVDSLRETVDDVSEGVEEMRQWRNQLGEAFQ